RRAIVRRPPIIIVVPAVLDPFRDVAVHVVKTEPVRGKAANGYSRLPVLVRRARSVFRCIKVGLLRRKPIAEGPAWRSARACRVFAFCLGQEPVELPRLVAEPIDIGLSISPGDVHDRMRSTPPALVVGPVSTTRAIRDAGIPFLERDFHLTYGKGGSDRHAVL